VIETKRLFLRELAPSDDAAVAAMFADPDVMKFVGAGGVLELEDAQRMIERERKHYAERGWGQWATVERATGRMVGVCGLIEWPDIDGAEELEVAYLLAKPYWGKGYATEVAAVILERALEIRPDPISLIYVDNAASIAVAKKIGMVHQRDVPFAGSTIGLYRYKKKRR
jgi:[ribosomal protein S5]-alanine N-acetyltransferase